MMPFLVYIISLLILSIFSYGFIDANFPYKLLPTVSEFIRIHKEISTGIYIASIFLLFISYFYILRRAERDLIVMRSILKFLVVVIVISIFAFPGFSYDVFNYIATAKIAFLYRENPYIVMPIQIPNEPMLAFLHASNKVALYGPIWILLTMIPHLFGFGLLMPTLYFFKLFITILYLICIWFLVKMSSRKIWTLIFFGLNPLVVIETLFSGHNDVVMMMFALCSVYLLQQKKVFSGLTLYIYSIFIKGATIVLVPVIFLILFGQRLVGKPIEHRKVYLWSTLFLTMVFFISPLREEMYPWYFIWPLTFAAILPKEKFIAYLIIAISFGLELRFAPFVYFRDWGGIVPLLKTVLMVFPPVCTLVFYAIRKKF